MSEGSKGKKGKGLFPPNPKQWGNERHGLALREQLGIKLEARLPVRQAFEQLLPAVVLRPHGSLLCAQCVIASFRTDLNRTWSAFAAPHEDGSVEVVYNDNHDPRRRRATLMEEFFHLRLGHRPSCIRLYADQLRTHDKVTEKEAYDSGAAALIPYRSLRDLVEAGVAVEEIADLFDVSTDLVLFRAKLTKLYRLLPRSAA
jgi:Zn-dependent peptidase ImmA (M78 family)